MDAAEIRKHSDALSKAIEAKKEAEDLLVNRKLALQQAEAALQGRTADVEKAHEALSQALKA